MKLRVPVFENKMLREISVSKTPDISEQCRYLYNEKLRDFWRLRQSRHMARMGETRNMCSILVGKPLEDRERMR
jgi:hypothetical protein